MKENGQVLNLGSDIFVEKNKMKHLLSILLLALSCQFSLAQTRLEGTVKDADTGEPIVFGTVALFQNGVLVMGTETDFEGYYSLIEIDPSNYEVTLSLDSKTIVKVRNVFVIGGKTTNLNMKVESDYLMFYPVISSFSLPMVEIDNTTQGHTFRSEEIRYLPIR